VAYTPELKRWIERVEATRPSRLERKARGEEFPPLTLVEREERLRAYHPDYQGESRREIRLGPNRGYAVYREIVDLLEAKSRIDPDTVDLSKVADETDVLVIGGGGAGTAAALLAQEYGAKIIIANKLRHGDANTMIQKRSWVGLSTRH
jgi:succinate dehydrogenase / fumarate reductase flavoprotein subunit/L-aspartate oxidase